MSVSISLISGTSKSFKLIQKQVPIRPNPNKKKGYDYVLETDMKTMRENFRELVRGLPDSPGILVISGGFGSNMNTTLKVLQSDESIRSAFGNFREESPFHWVCNTLLTFGYKEIRFELGEAA
jgi:hypothetical protein